MLTLPHRRFLMVSPAFPLAAYAAANGGALFDFRRTATTWQDTAGTIPADDVEVGICQAAVSGTLPVLAEGNAYGVDGVPTEAEALAAVTTGNLTVYTAAGDDDPARFIASIFTGRGLRYVPEPEV